MLITTDICSKRLIFVAITCNLDFHTLTHLFFYFGRKGKITELVKSVVESGGYSKHDWSDPDSRGILRSLLMTASDIIAISKPWKVQYQVAEVIYEEFFYQGDLDKLDDKIPDPVGMFNRDERKDIQTC